MRVGKCLLKGIKKDGSPGVEVEVQLLKKGRFEAIVWDVLVEEEINDD